MTSPPAADAATSTRPRVALYGHDTLGLGHLRRNLALAGALAPESPDGEASDVLLLTGSAEAGLFPLPVGVETVVVPGIRKDNRGAYRARSLRTPLSKVVALRAAILRTALLDYAPDQLVVDKTPYGFHGELAGVLPLLKAAGTRLVLGLRDVLDEPRVAAAQWRDEHGDRAARDLYDEIWVYGDRRVHDLVEACAMGEAAGRRARHLGYLAPRTPERPGHRPLGDVPYVLVTVGGGQDGSALVRAAVQMTAPAGVEVVVLTGPQAGDDQLSATRGAARRRGGVHVHRFSRHAQDWLRGAEAVIAMGGANTVTELLTTDVPALIVPRVKPRQEQLVRAMALQRHAALDVLVPELLCPERLGDWVRARLGTRIDRSHLRMDGLDQVRTRTRALVGGGVHVAA